MKNSKILFDALSAEILPGESRDEVHSIVGIILEELFGLSKADLIAGKVVNVSREQEEALSGIVARLNRREPIQYVIGSGHFFGRAFNVSPAVLIPRPETEMLVSTVLKLTGRRNVKSSILDIGTGSGCIAITLALELPNATVYACDVSPDALAVARSNAAANHAAIHFMQHDVLKHDLPFGMFDVIVSNPPYVTESEQKDIDRNVLDHEPHLALFVPDDDPLIFYKAITSKGASALLPGGLLAVEINEKFGEDIAVLFSRNGFLEIEVIRDLSGKNRIVTGRKPNG
ncbi:MAG TPA: peptide chain release factor N(5)-glutamine methyltransferase [Chryseosolibacter sp.]|nr:peptide chain release factor N(5)-glutamine methyltransferase [Chryseosolibacter sp.]